MRSRCGVHELADPPLFPDRPGDSNVARLDCYAVYLILPLDVIVVQLPAYLLATGTRLSPRRVKTLKMALTSIMTEASQMFGHLSFALDSLSHFHWYRMIKVERVS